MEDLTNNLLMATLNGLREDVKDVRDNQDVLRDNQAAMKDQLHGLDARMKTLGKDVRKDAMRWGAGAGIATSAGGILVALVKAFWGHKP